MVQISILGRVKNRHYSSCYIKVGDELYNAGTLVTREKGLFLVSNSRVNLELIWNLFCKDFATYCENFKLYLQSCAERMSAALVSRALRASHAEGPGDEVGKWHARAYPINVLARCRDNHFSSRVLLKWMSFLVLLVFSPSEAQKRYVKLCYNFVSRWWKIRTHQKTLKHETALWKAIQPSRCVTHLSISSVKDKSS